MGEDTDRPQDGGRRRTRKGAPSAETATLLARYQSAMRDDLGAILDELTPRAPDPGLGIVKVEPERPSIAKRGELWTLAIKLGRELGTEIDARPPDPSPRPRAATRRRAAPDYG